MGFNSAFKGLKVAVTIRHPRTIGTVG